MFNSVYGPVNSWRYGRSLGIDPIGNISTCSFNCVYCQLGEIEVKKIVRSVFISTKKIQEDLLKANWQEADIITLSGSGEPTLALNLREIITSIKKFTEKPTLVLTNGTLLAHPRVAEDLAQADQISIKIDAIFQDSLKRINRPVKDLNIGNILNGIEQFAQEYKGRLGIQTMILAPPDENFQRKYISLIQRLGPAEVQLNTPSRPKPLKHELEGRGNHAISKSLPYPVKFLKCVNNEVLQTFATKIQKETGISVKFRGMEE